MNKAVLYALVACLYILTPVCALSALGTMVSKKYEVDEAYWMIDSNSSLTADQKAEQIRELDQKGRKMKYETCTFAFISLLAFTAATALLIKRRSIIKKHENT